MPDIQQSTAEEQTLTVGDKAYPASTLSAEVKEMLGLYEQALQMVNAAKRQVIIHDLAVQNIVSRLEKALADPEE